MDYAKFEKSKDILQAVVYKAADDQLAFHIHYWGAEHNHRSNSPHQHSFFEACYVVEGSGEYQEGDTTYPLRQGTLFLSRPQIVHQIRNNVMTLIWVAFELNEEAASLVWKERFAKLAAQGPLILHHAEETPLVLLWMSLNQYAADASESDRLILHRLTHTLLAMFPRIFLGADTEPISRPARSNSKIVVQAEKYIQDNIRQPLPLDSVAKYFYISERHLARLMKQELGMTFTQYVQAYRIHEAARLLRDSELSIKQIAEETGFGSVHYFSRIFAEQRGTPPAAYRKQHQLS